MAKTIALLQQKGGSGKTTTSVNLAGGLRECGYKVLITDMDKDKPDAWSWAAKSESMKDIAIQIDEKQAREELSKLKLVYDFIIIDTPPNFQTAALKAALLADLVVIPTAPSGMDLSGLLEAKELAQTADRPYKLLANRVIKNTVMGRSLLQVLEEDGHGFETCIPQSTKFVEAESQGLYIGEYEPNGNAHHAVKQVCKEVLDFFKLAHKKSSSPAQNTQPIQNKISEIKNIEKIENIENTETAIG